MVQPTIRAIIAVITIPPIAFGGVADSGRAKRPSGGRRSKRPAF
jgi:hypothetical protein